MAWVIIGRMRLGLLAPRLQNLPCHELACCDRKGHLHGKILNHGWFAESLLVHFASEEAPTLPVATTPGVPNVQFSVQKLELPPCHDYDEPLWMQHEGTFDWNIDIAVVPLSVQQTEGLRIVCVNDYKFERLFHFVGSDVLVIGHPLSSDGTKYPITLPIWKRGSIASEPLVPWNMRPAFLVDVRTSKGMSGSPVIRTAFGPTAKADLTLDVTNVVCSEFMGIYSGRLYDDERNANIGLVWYQSDRRDHLESGQGLT